MRKIIQLSEEERTDECEKENRRMKKREQVSEEERTCE